MSAPLYFVVFEGKNPGIFSSWWEASDNNNIDGQHFRTFATLCEAIADHSIHREPQEIWLLRAALYGAPIEGKRNTHNRCVMDRTKQDIEDAMTIGKWVADNPIADDEDVDEDDESTDGGQAPTNGQSSNWNA